ncbi:MAG: TonB-dependent receptor, partial [Rikenellaceae bacterium]|nr:TonB-dependent receptor [Rikenellaceae bacterium]
KIIHYDFRLNGRLGASREDYSYNFLMNQGPLVYANFFHTSNLDRNRATYYESAGEKERTNSMFATAQLGFREYLFLDLTGRMDYFSTLHGTASTHKFYPSVGLSGVITDMFEIPKEVLSFWKLRTSYSQVGTPLRRYISQEYVTIDDQTQAVTAQGYPAGSNLVPERTKSFEAGTDFRLFSNKLDVSFTYYNANTYNQLFEYDKEPSSGYSKGWINAGKVNNWGSELSASGRVDLGPVRWTPSVAYSLNRNKIKSLLPETFIDESGEQITAPTEFVVANAGDSYLQILTVGGTMGDIYVNTFVKDHQGAIYVHPNTSTIQADPNARVYAGSALPLYNLGFRNSFTYKGITLDFLIDARVGGIVVSSTQALMDRFGTSKQSADARDAGGVPIYGKGLLDAKNFYTVAGSGDQGVLANYVYSATNVRLRELTIGYDIPSSLLWDKIDVRVAFVGRNLWMIHKKAPFDPEITGSTGTYYQGYDYFMPPSLRNLGFSISVSF